MNDRPTEAEVMAAVDRDDYQWLVDNVFIPAMAEIMREEHTAALVRGPRPRARRPVSRRHSHHRTRRSHEFRP